MPPYTPSLRVVAAPHGGGASWGAPAMENVAAGPRGWGPPRRRGKDNPAVQGAAHLKTGSLRDVAAVAGVVHGASGRRYTLVALANHPNANALRPVIEALIAWTARDQNLP